MILAKAFLTGPKSCGNDASVFAQIPSAASSWFETPVRDAVASRASLVAYGKRTMAIYFPDQAWSV